jgi:hypothetical protein
LLFISSEADLFRMTCSILKHLKDL